MTAQMLSTSQLSPTTKLSPALRQQLSQLYIGNQAWLKGWLHTKFGLLFSGS